MPDLTEQVRDIRSRKDLADFVYKLLNDLREDSDSWENHTLERFLEALAAWVEDMDGYYKSRGELIPDQLNWQTLGEILLAAKMYE